MSGVRLDADDSPAAAISAPGAASAASPSAASPIAAVPRDASGYNCVGQDNAGGNILGTAQERAVSMPALRRGDAEDTQRQESVDPARPGAVVGLLLCPDLALSLPTLRADSI